MIINRYQKIFNNIVKYDLNLLKITIKNNFYKINEYKIYILLIKIINEFILLLMIVIIMMIINN